MGRKDGMKDGKRAEGEGVVDGSGKSNGGRGGTFIRNNTLGEWGSQ